MKFKALCTSARRLSAMLLLSALIAGTLSGCGVIIINNPSAETEAATTRPPETTAAPETTEALGTEVPPETTEIPEETVKVTPVTLPSRIEEAKKRLEGLSSIVDISGFNLIVASASDTADVLFCEEDSPLYAARSARNGMLYEKYAVEIRTIYESADTDKIYEDLLQAYRTGATADYYLDLIIIPADRAGGFLAKGLVKDMKTLPFYNAKEGCSSGNVGTSRYFDLGDGTDAPEYIYSLYFNRTMVGKEMEDMLYSEALGGGLTWDSVITASRTAEVREADIGTLGDSGALLGELAPYLAGFRFVTKDRDGVPSIGTSEGEAQAIDSLLGHISKLTCYTPAEGAPSAKQKFIEGSIPFYLGTLADITELYDEKLEWGLLTLPSESGVGAISGNRPVVCIPATNTRLEQTSIWLTGFNAASGDWIRDEFLRHSIENHMRDNHSCLTLRKILSSRTELTFEHLFAGYYEGLWEATFGAAGNALTGGKKFSEALGDKLAALNKKLSKLP